MKKAPSKPTFTVQLRLNVTLDVEIEGGSLVEALEFGKSLKLADVLSVEDAVSVNDYSLRAYGVYDQKGWDIEQ